jgi:hypothetical protein
MLGPQHGGGGRDPAVPGGDLLGQRGRHRSRPGPVPRDGGGERARWPVDRNQVVEVVLADLVAGSGPVRPEVTQVGAHGGGPAVDQLGAQLEIVKGLVPELLLGPRLQDPVADARQRRRDDQGPDQIGTVPGDGLGDPAADVIAGDHRPAQAQFLDQPDDAPGLGSRVVLTGRIGLVLVRLPEAPQVRHDHIGADPLASLAPGGRHQRRDLTVVGPVTRPAVQQQHGRGPVARPSPVVGQPEAVDRCLLAHTRTLRPRLG